MIIFICFPWLMFVNILSENYHVFLKNTVYYNMGINFLESFREFILAKIGVDSKDYNKVKNQINDDRILRVFKGAMLLLATIGSGHSLKKSKSN